MKFVLAFAILIGSAVASNAAGLVFACNGKVGDTAMNNVGLVVTDKTVSFNGYIVPIRQIDDAQIYFSDMFTGGRKNALGMTNSVDGVLDRVTGAMAATVGSSLGDKATTSNIWDMICRPTSRMF